MASHAVHEHIVVDRIEELRQVDVHSDAIALSDELADLTDRLMGTATRAKPEA